MDVTNGRMLRTSVRAECRAFWTVWLGGWVGRWAGHGWTARGCRPSQPFAMHAREKDHGAMHSLLHVKYACRRGGSIQRRRRRTKAVTQIRRATNLGARVDAAVGRVARLIPTRACHAPNRFTPTGNDSSTITRPSPWIPLHISTFGIARLISNDGYLSAPATSPPLTLIQYSFTVAIAKPPPN